MTRRRPRRPGWRDARRVLLEALRGGREPGDAPGEVVGRVRRLGDGLSYRAFVAECAPAGPASGETLTLGARLPQPDAPGDPTEAADREVRLVGRLAELDLPIRIPRIVATVPVPGGTAIVQEMLEGLPLEMRAGRSRLAPWEAVAEVAVAVHAIEPERVADAVPGFPTRRDHARSRLRELEEAGVPEAAEALAWALEHLPPPEASRFVHGDLLGQNILLPLERLVNTATEVAAGEGSPETEEEKLGVLDWEAALLGDPAYDLAIVTRGVRRPFQTSGGLEELLEAYARRGGRPIERAEVHLHELALAAGFYRQAVEGYGEGSPHAENVRRRIGSVLRRAAAA